MEDELVSQETAKLAKEKGFDEYCTSGYITRIIAGKYIDDNFDHYKYGGKDSEIFEFYTNIHFIPLYEPYYKRPTQSLLQRWLREVHKIYLTVIHRAYSGLEKIDKYDYLLEGTYVVYRYFDTYEQALEEGLKVGLNLVKYDPNEKNLKN